LKGTGSYMVRFANIDARLTVWVDREMPFDEGHTYSPPEIWGPGEREEVEAKLRKAEDNDDRVAQAVAALLLDRRGPTVNDLEPASIGSKGAAVVVQHLPSSRDTHSTTHPQGADSADRN